MSGTAALIHGAWPWWKSHGEETTEVILKSAIDLGEEGVDGTYGWGMLNVEGALSPPSSLCSALFPLTTRTTVGRGGGRDSAPPAYGDDDSGRRRSRDICPGTGTAGPRNSNLQGLPRTMGRARGQGVGEHGTWPGTNAEGRGM